MNNYGILSSLLGNSMFMFVSWLISHYSADVDRCVFTEVGFAAGLSSYVVRLSVRNKLFQGL